MLTSKVNRLLYCGSVIALGFSPIYGQQAPVVTPASQALALAPLPVTEPSLRTEPKAPRITCNGDQLTIEADNSSLAAILSSIRSCIAFEVQVPTALADERTFAKLGPGLAREVLNELLDSFGLNYVIESSAKTPAKILAASITLRPLDSLDARTDTAHTLASNLTMTPARRMWLAAINQGRPESSPSTLDEGERNTLTPSTATTPEATSAITPPLAGAGPVMTSHSPDSSEPTSSEMAGQAKTQAGDGEQVATSSDGSALPSSTAAAQDKSAASPLQNQIKQMQQLFEQRKSLTVNPAQSSTSQ